MQKSTTFARTAISNSQPRLALSAIFSTYSVDLSVLNLQFVQDLVALAIRVGNPAVLRAAAELTESVDFNTPQMMARLA